MERFSNFSGSCWISAPQAISLGVLISVTGLCVVNQPLDFILQDKNLGQELSLCGEVDARVN